MNYKLDSTNCLVHQRTQHKTVGDWHNAVVCKANDFVRQHQVSFIGDLMYDGQILFSDEPKNQYMLWVLTDTGTHLAHYIDDAKQHNMWIQMIGYAKGRAFTAYILHPAKRLIFDITADFTSLEKATAAIDEITALI